MQPKALLSLLAVALFGGWLGPESAALATTYQVGPTRSYTTLASLPALNPGDIVEIDPGTYNEVKRWTRPGTAAQTIVIRGVGPVHPVIDAAGQIVDGALPHPRAAFQIEADYVTIENLDFKNARNGNNGAGIRVTSADYVVVRNCRITDCDMGMMSDRNQDLLVESCEIASNGTSLFNGYSHNFYLGGTNTTLRFCYIHDALFGQNFKTRGHFTQLLYNYIADSQDGEVGFVDAAETAATNSHAVMIGNIVISKPRLSGYNSGRFIQFGQDSGGQHNGKLFAFNNTFIAGDGRIQFLSANATGAGIIAANNILYGSDRIVGTVGAGVSGTNNWVQSSATVPATFSGSVQGTDPGFVNRLGRDFRLTRSSGCRDVGLNVLSFQDASGAAAAGQPAFEYVNHLQSRARPSDGRLDLGAYEYAKPVITSFRLNGSDCLIDFTSESGLPYELQRSGVLSGTGWLGIATNIGDSSGTSHVTDTNAATLSRLFYRVNAL